MLWFKHFCNASDGEFVSLIESQFGLEGYARWFKLLEKVGSRMDKSDLCEATFPVRFWCQYLVVRRPLLLRYLSVISQLGKIETITNGQLLTIRIPKMLEIKDEYSKKSGHYPDNVLPKNIDTDIDTEVRIKKETNTKTKPCRQWLDDDVELKLARWFIKLLDDRQYEWKGGKKPDEQKWAIEFDKLIRIDKREPKRIAEIFKWCQAPGNFWRKNILSPHKLRSQWGALTEAIKAEQQPKISVTPRRSQDGWLIYPPDGGGRNLCNKHKISMPAGQKCPECAEAENARS